MRVGQARKRDEAEGAIVDALRAYGVRVYRISGFGLPDLLCCYRGRWTPLEVKSGKGQLTEEQAKSWLEAPFAIVRTVPEALRQLGIKVR